MTSLLKLSTKKVMKFNGIGTYFLSLLHLLLRFLLFQKCGSHNKITLTYLFTESMLFQNFASLKVRPSYVSKKRTAFEGQTVKIRIGMFRILCSSFIACLLACWWLLDTKIYICVYRKWGFREIAHSFGSDIYLGKFRESGSL